MAHPKKLLTETEVAALLGWRVTTLQRRRWLGVPPEFLKIGRSVRYDPEVIAAFVASGRRTSTSATSGSEPEAVTELVVATEPEAVDARPRVSTAAPGPQTDAAEPARA